MSATVPRIGQPYCSQGLIPDSSLVATLGSVYSCQPNQLSPDGFVLPPIFLAYHPTDLPGLLDPRGNSGTGMSSTTISPSPYLKTEEPRALINHVLHYRLNPS